MAESERELWRPRKRDIDKVKETCACPPGVEISKLPKGANLMTGAGIRDGALVLSPSHLKYIRFPLHPLFQVVWSALNLHPMQLSPNSYLELLAFLALGLQVGVSIDYSDFFHFHDCELIRNEVDYFHLASKPNCKFFNNKPSSHKDWKNQPLVITGNWAAPELRSLKIPSTFAASAAALTTRSSPERIQWLRNHLVGSCLDIKKYSTPAILLQISGERDSIIYSLFQPTHLKLKPDLGGKELAAYIVESLDSTEAIISDSSEHVAERERIRDRIEKKKNSARGIEEDPERAYVNPVEPTMVIEKKRSASSSALAFRNEKRSKTVVDPSTNSSPTCSEPSSSHSRPFALDLMSSHSELEAGISIQKGHVFPNTGYWIPKFRKDDGNLVTGEEKLVGNPDACLAVWRGLSHPADAHALQKEAPQVIMEATNSRLIEVVQLVSATHHQMAQSVQDVKRLTDMNKTLKAELDQERQRAIELESQLHAQQKSHKAELDQKRQRLQRAFLLVMDLESQLIAEQKSHKAVQESLSQLQSGLRKEKEKSKNSNMVDSASQSRLYGNNEDESHQDSRVAYYYNHHFKSLHMRTDVHTNQNLSKHPPNSDTNRVITTSPTIPYFPLQSNQETSSILLEPLWS